MTLTTEKMETLRRVFALSDHEFLRGNTYVKERAISERIEEVDPAWGFVLIGAPVYRDNWVSIIASMTICGVTRQGVGSHELTGQKKNTGEQYDKQAEKAAATDALKRTARLFGVGRYLTDLTQSDDIRNEAQLEKWLQKRGLIVPDANIKPPQNNRQTLPSHWTQDEEAVIKFYGWCKSFSSELTPTNANITEALRNAFGDFEKVSELTVEPSRAMAAYIAWLSGYDIDLVPENTDGANWGEKRNTDFVLQAKVLETAKDIITRHNAAITPNQKTEVAYSAKYLKNKNGGTFTTFLGDDNSQLTATLGTRAQLRALGIECDHWEPGNKYELEFPVAIDMVGGEIKDMRRYDVAF